MYDKGDIVDVTITGIVPYGVFAKVGEYTGLIHISEISDKYVRDITQFAMVGDMVKVVVMKLMRKPNNLNSVIRNVTNQNALRFVI